MTVLRPLKEKSYSEFFMLGIVKLYLFGSPSFATLSISGPPIANDNIFAPLSNVHLQHHLE